jgi:hypothetical protein
MSSRHISFRIDSSTFERLEARSRQTGETRSHLAKTFIEEGLRMEAHPGIVFRSGPAGRRPGLATAPDVWEVARVLRGIDARGEEAIHETAELTGLTPEQVRIVAHYYAEYQTEIDGWIRRVDKDADRAEATWRRARDLLRA